MNELLLVPRARAGVWVGGIERRRRKLQAACGRRVRGSRHWVRRARRKRRQRGPLPTSRAARNRRWSCRRARSGARRSAPQWGNVCCAVASAWQGPQWISDGKPPGYRFTVGDLARDTKASEVRL